MASPLNQNRIALWWYVLVGVMIMLTVQSYLQEPSRTTIQYSDFKALLKAGDIRNLSLAEHQIMGELRVKGALPSSLSADTAAALKTLGTGDHAFVTNRVVDPQLVESLDKAGVAYRGVTQNRWLSTILAWVFPLLILFVFWSFMLRRMGGGGAGMMAIGKSRAKVYMETDTKVTFTDVAGVDEAKQELMEVVEFLREPQRYGRLGARIPKGVLLVGPPGTGKTLLARAVAGEAGVPFLSISGSEFVELFVGVGAARVRDLFEQARSKAPAIIFIDELDALGRARGAMPGGGVDEKEQTLNQLLVEMDGFDPSSGLILLAATNRPEILDPALLRAGRFDRQVLVDRPDRPGRVQILNVHLRNIRLAPALDVDQIAAMTPGFTGADLANLINEAALLATRRGAEAVEQRDFMDAIERIVAGLEKKQRLLMPREKEVIAHHEMGHALVAMSLPDVDPVHKVSIIPRGIGALGYTLQRPTQDRFLLTQEELEHRMMVLLGGRAAEYLIFNQLSTGAMDDLAKATDIARHMVMRYGMNPKLGHVTYDGEQSGYLQNTFSFKPREYSEETAFEIDEAVRELVDRAFDEAVALLKKQSNRLREGARRLQEHETLGEAELADLANVAENGAAVNTP
ncbi:ATP-dependent zinc metalloprotease FtsH [Mangrovitalea sediminis]|uniref:ATP-dependent zinc metalloprotease FtsH n=1 Tax=Mangrovitalea sediminis TaxID=1982043 RepID=UPI000BE4D26A|nr:ATP-dependent zinc metalloprotease FtsH [Mangrovitalea sediminis]